MLWYRGCEIISVLESTVSEVVFIYFSRIVLERTAKESDSLVREKINNAIVYSFEYHGAREIPWESARTIG